MLPAASVSGFYFAHPQARYFGLGKISKDQVEDYAVRKNMDLEDSGKVAGSELELLKKCGDWERGFIHLKKT